MNKKIYIIIILLGLTANSFGQIVLSPTCSNSQVFPCGLYPSVLVGQSFSPGPSNSCFGATVEMCWFSVVGNGNIYEILLNEDVTAPGYISTVVYDGCPPSANEITCYANAGTEINTSVCFFAASGVQYYIGLTRSPIFLGTFSFVDITVNCNGSCSCINPTAAFSSNVVNEGFPTNFTDQSSNVASGAIYDWDFDNDGTFEITGAAPGNRSHIYPIAGNYTALLRITNPGGCIDQITNPVTVSSCVPSNDECINASHFPTPGYQMFLGTLGCITQNLNSNFCCYPSTYRDFWFIWTAAQSGDVSLEVTPPFPVSGNYRMGLTVFDGVICNNSPIIACKDGGIGGPPQPVPTEVCFTAVVGQQYLINVAVPDQAVLIPGGQFSIEFSPSPTPCEGPISGIIEFTGACVGEPTVFSFNTTNNVANATFTWDFGDGSATSSMTSPTHTYVSEGQYTVSLTVEVPGYCPFFTETIVDVGTCSPPCDTCITSFSPLRDKRYVLSAWVKEDTLNPVKTYLGPAISLNYPVINVTQGPFLGKGNIIDGWQRIEEEFTVPSAATAIKIQLNNNGTNEVFFDDIRIYPFDANMKSFVYDPVTLRLSAELDENNYATYYEYDEQGKLVRVKKETQEGIKTIQESRDNTVK